MRQQTAALRDFGPHSTAGLCPLRVRDLAMFNLAIDSKLRGCDVVALKVEHIAPGGNTIDRATVRQRKTGRPAKFELTDQTREAVDDSGQDSRATDRGYSSYH
jgi:integrase